MKEQESNTQRKPAGNSRLSFKLYVMAATKKISALNYFGGKSPFLEFLYKNFPDQVHLVDCMCGSASVAINAPHQLITINDINDDVVNFFRVLRNNYKDFSRAIKYTPFSRSEFYAAALPTNNDPVEAARKFFIRSLQGYAGMGSQNTEKGWGYEVSPINQYNGQIRKHFRVDTWNSKLKALDFVANRLRNFQIEHLDVLELVERYARPGVLLYIDPPYLRQLRSDRKRYRHEFYDRDHNALAEKVTDLKCYVAISGYDGELYNTLFPSDKWFKTLDKLTMNNTKKVPRRECLWTNYNPALIKPQTLF